jgi:hypothetical protein
MRKTQTLRDVAVLRLYMYLTITQPAIVVVKIVHLVV